MKRQIFLHKIILVFITVLTSSSAFCQTDTLRVMAYNVLNYGEYPLCQGPNINYHNYLKTIVQYANPDILSLEKMGSIKYSSSDHAYTAEIDFQDSILKYALNPVFPGRFNYAPFTNYSGANTFSMMYYNQQKLGCIGIVLNYPNNEDFNTYKLFYKDPNLATTHDTTFLYVTVNHDISGSSSATERGLQIAGVMNQMKSKFMHLANMINMGDFNVRYSTEPLYQTLTNPSDTNFRYYDPPFYPDALFSYPADWDSDPDIYTKYLTTSTRALGNVPNSCGTNGGGKNWYDHIFLSPWIVNNTNYISYIHNSYRAIGNDGHRLGISVNDAPTNTSAPAPVIDALFQMSNKYPVMVDLLVNQNTTSISPMDPEGHPAAVLNTNMPETKIGIHNPVQDQLELIFAPYFINKELQLDCIDVLGRVVMHQNILVTGNSISVPVKMAPGRYFIRIGENGHTIFNSIVESL